LSVDHATTNGVLVGINTIVAPTIVAFSLKGNGVLGQRDSRVTVKNLMRNRHDEVRVGVRDTACAETSIEIGT
jgi:hypothetical protein